LDNDFSDQAMEKQAANLRDICSRYERDKGLWAAAVDDLEKKVKVKT
jgi:kinesin family protein C2/C3